MHTLIVIFLLTFLYVFLRAFQQRNVTAGKLPLIIPVSYLMGFLEISNVSISTIRVIQNGYIEILSIGFFAGTGGWMGAFLAIWLHKKLYP